MKVSLARVLAAFVLAGALAVMACQAQPSAFVAHSPDGQLDVSVSRATIEDAFGKMCSSPGLPPCDHFRKYEVHVSVDHHRVSVVFFHHDIGTRLGEDFTVLPAFACEFPGQIPTCSPFGEVDLIVRRP